VKPTSKDPFAGARKRTRREEVSSPEEAQTAQELKLSEPDTFVSLPSGPRTPEERIARIEALLRFLGLPHLDEFNRQDREANARAGGQPSRDLSSPAAGDSES
jgi:hypothetical protein